MEDSSLETQVKWPVRATGWAYRIVLTVILALVLFCQSWTYACKVELRWHNGVCLLVGLLGAAALFLLARVLTGRIRRRSRRLMCMGLISLALAALIFYCAAHYAFTAGWDPGTIYQNAYNIADHLGDLSDDYYSRYPNNLLYTWALMWLYRLSWALGIEQEYFFVLGVQSFSYALTAFLAYLCADWLTGERHPAVPLWCWLAALILICASPWVAVQYTDSAALLLVSLAVTVYLKACRGPRRPLWAGIFVFLCVIGFHIKPQAVILLIAAALIHLFTAGKQLFTRAFWHRAWAVLLACVIGLGAAEGVYRTVRSTSPFQLDEEAAFGATHFLMMGLNDKEMGVWNMADVEYSAKRATAEKRRAAELKRIGKRLEKLGPAGLLTQAVRKTLTNYSDGTFAWEQEGMFYNYDTYYFRGGSDWGFEHIPAFYISEDYPDMVSYSFSWLFRLIMQCAWLAVLLLSVFSFARGVNRPAAVLQLAILGLTLFELIFEARARYLFSYVPVYILLAGIGLGNLTDFWKTKTRKAR